MIALLKQLIKIQILSIKGIYLLCTSIAYSGVNLMALLRFSSQLQPNKQAISDGNESLTYHQLFNHSENLAYHLHITYHISRDKRIAILCKNSSSMIKALFANASLGADIYLLSIEMSALQFENIYDKYHFDLVIHDQDVFSMISNNQNNQNHKYQTILITDPIFSGQKHCSTSKHKCRHGGKIIVLTGGTTGNFKTADRKPSLIQFLAPFLTVLSQLKLGSYTRVFIATPIYHGFGLASLLIAFILGASTYIRPQFNDTQLATDIHRHKIEVVSLVPLMLQRLIKHNPSLCMSLKCIISGGAALHSSLVHATIIHFGNILFNLYGTSEAGFCMLATPQTLASADNTIGRPIKGVHLRLLDQHHKSISSINVIGHICIRSAWTAGQKKWIDTGDLAYKNEQGLYFLCGRIDDMIVSGGENVYPMEVENILMTHPAIQDVAVIGVTDVEFGQALHAYIVLDLALPAPQIDEIKHWLKPRIARFQMPKTIEFLAELPYSATGKTNKKILSSTVLT